MELEQIEERYLNKKVCHMATGLIFEIYDIVEWGRLTKHRFEVMFKDPVLDDLPFEVQSSANLRDIETHYRIIN